MRILIHDPRSDDEGVASTVGTIMALLVFLTFLSLIVNQYVPVWMKDSEASHMNTALGQFGGLKGAIDLQILAAQAAQVADSYFIPVTAASAVTLGIDGVPIFAASTLGTLRSAPDEGAFTVTFDYMIQGLSGPAVRTRVLERSNGTVDLAVANRYFVPQRVAYVNGAVVRYQSDGQIIRAQPTFAVARGNDTLDVTFGLVSLYGQGTIVGTSTEVVNAQVFAVDRQDYGGTSGESFPDDARIWINHTSAYGLAWYKFFNSTLATSLGLTGVYTRTPLDESFEGRIDGTTIYRVSTSLDSSRQVYVTRLEIRNNPGVLALSIFRLQHAQVQIGVGESATDIRF
jgi:hypothetical protein